MVQGLLYADFFGSLVFALARTFSSALYLYIVLSVVVLALIFRGFLLFLGFDEPSNGDFYWSFFSIPLWIAAILISLFWGGALRAMVFLVIGIINIWLVHIKFGLVRRIIS